MSGCSGSLLGRVTSKPRKLTERSLENAALFYLRRYSASRAQVQRFLERKVARATRLGGCADAAAWRAPIQALLDRLVRASLVDDAAFARARATSLRAAGRSTRAIAAKLRQKGIASGQVEQEVQRIREETSDEEAARTLARKRRLGPFRPPEQRGEHRQKDLAKLAAAGFSYEVARRVLDGGCG